MFSWMPGEGQTGEYAGIRFAATDGSFTVSEEITIAVSPVPVVSDEQNHNVALGPGGGVVTVGTVQTAVTSDLHGLAMSFDATGGLIWRVETDGPNTEYYAAAVENTGDIIVVGYEETTPGDRDWLIRRLSGADGASAPFTTVSVGGVGHDMAYDVALDSEGNIFVVGVIDDPSSGEDWTIYSFDQAGSLRWQTQMGSRNGVLRAVAVDGLGNIYVAGYYEFTAGNRDWLIRKFENDFASGAAVQSFKPDGIGGTGEDMAYDVAVDDDGNVYVVGLLEGATRDWTIYSFTPEDGGERWNVRLGSRDGVLTGIAAGPDFVYTVGHYEFVSGNKDWLIRRFATGDGTSSADQVWKPDGLGQAGKDMACGVAFDAASGAVWVDGFSTADDGTKEARLIRYMLPSAVPVWIH
jgi:hypothetical protein